MQNREFCPDIFEGLSTFDPYGPKRSAGAQWLIRGEE
ncbi:hypothetical protein FHX45_005153 [Amycolatopsis granulosa]|nr:hypothetical protein [Amycolatopsis granulosa]